jgi:tRNA A37 threonylcarbamoyladenosine biosynthesis protein TsaE
VRSIGIEDILSDSGGIVLIEWPEKMGSLLPKERIDIHISETDGKREIRITTV